MGISKVQPMRPALDACIDAINDGFDPYVQPYIDAAQQATVQAQAATVLAQAATQAALAATEAADEATETATAAAESITDGYIPMLTVGAADGIKGGGPTIDGTFLHRITGGGQASDGPATIEVIRGNTVRWNQLVSVSEKSIASAERSTYANAYLQYNNPVSIVAGHVYFGRAKFSIIGDATLAAIYLTGTASQGVLNSTTHPEGSIFTATADLSAPLELRVTAGSYPATFGCDVTNIMLVDLTVMFGAGNEPRTADEFTNLYPLPYYEHDAGSLLSIQMVGIESVGFNQWDELWEVGGVRQTDGTLIGYSDRIRSKNYIPVIGGQTYYINALYGVMACYDGNKDYIGNVPYRNATVSGQYYLDMPANACYVRFAMGMAYGTTYKNDICINLSDPAHNGTYKPYRRQTRSIPTINLRSAGRVYDELLENERITRMSEVDLGTLNWQTSTDATGQYFYATLSGAKPAAWASLAGNIKCAIYDTVPSTNVQDKNIAISANNSTIYIRDATYDTAASFKTAMSGVYVVFELTTPTITTINPPLNMSYRAEKGGTETVLVPEGEMSAPVPMVIVYGSTPDGILNRAAALIAAQDGPTATAYHSVGSYLTMNGALYRVTTAIAIGETITPGTNVTATTVMEEVIRLTQ